MRRRTKNFFLALAVFSLAGAAAGCHRHTHAKPDTRASAEPDKVLFERAQEDIKNKRYDVARLTLQTLLNTYPDSDYLAQAKLLIADSYFEEGTTGALTHAEVEYKDFITFFPNAPETALAQYRAALCHYRQLEKPDRDRSHGLRAEREFQLLLKNYPESEYAADGERKLIAVQEVLAESEFRVGRFYFIKGTWRATVSRLADLIENYPNFSQRDQAVWMVARSYEQQVPMLWKPDPARAGDYYARLAREHPLSDLAEDARQALARLGLPIPQPDPALLARAQQVKPVMADSGSGEREGLLSRLLGMWSDRPDTSAAAARLGPPPLEPAAPQTSLPPPPYLSAMQGGVEVQTLEEAPGGTVTQTRSAEEKVEPAGANQQPAEAAPQQKPEEGKQPPKKKSFWRKIIPFI